MKKTLFKGLAALAIVGGSILSSSPAQAYTGAGGSVGNYWSKSWVSTGYTQAYVARVSSSTGRITYYYGSSGKNSYSGNHTENYPYARGANFWG